MNETAQENNPQAGVITSPKSELPSVNKNYPEHLENIEKIRINIMKEKEYFL